MTLLDDRPGRIRHGSDSLFADVARFADEILVDLVPDAAAPAAKALFTELTHIYSRVRDERKEISPAQRDLVRAAGRMVAGAGGEPTVVAEKIGELASFVIDRIAARSPGQVVRLVEAAQLLTQDFLAAAEMPVMRELTKFGRWNVARCLVLNEAIPPAIERALDTDYVVGVLRFARQVPWERLAALIEEHEDGGVLSSPAEGGAILLAPERIDGSLARLCGASETVFGQRPWLATANRSRMDIASGYQEAKNVLTLVMATGQEPARYRFEDVLVEYAVTRDPDVARRLAGLIEPLLDNEVLLETLQVLIKDDLNRTTAARDLFIHRSTLDYRIRRIEEITGKNPMTSRGARLLQAALTAQAMARCGP